MILRTKDSKHAKYNTSNPFSRALIKNFFDTISEFYSWLTVDSVLDVGCGEGFVLERLNSVSPIKKCSAMDIDPIDAADAQGKLSFCDVQVGNIYDIKQADESFDLVICSEVLEHLENPGMALLELERVCRKFAILSVPREPLWRSLNMARLKYLENFGNPPGHINHWNQKQFVSLISQYFDIIAIKSPLPWTMVLCRKKTCRGNNSR